jgi:hypothetical protein
MDPDMDFVFDHPFVTALFLTVVLGVPMAIVGGQRTNALLEALRARFGGEIVRRRISPSELRITSSDRVLSFSSFLGSTSSSGAQSPASVFVRVYFVRWKSGVPEFALRRRSRTLDFSRSLGIERRRELLTGDAEFDEEYCVIGECEIAVPYLLSIKQDLLALQQIAGSNDVRLRLSREAPPQENLWRRGDPIFRVLGTEEIEGSKVACLTLHVDGKALRSEAESTCILTAAQRFAVALEAVGVERA